jgi:hypothetical protein
MNLVYTKPLTRINEKWNLANPKIKQIVDNFNENNVYKNFIDTFESTDFSHTLNQRPFLHVVAETVYNYPSTFISEKTMKPITNKRPFIIVGPLYSLKNIRELGFKTFHDFWDEGYDEVEDPEERLLRILNIIEVICHQSLDDLRSICFKMNDVLNYNFDYYINHFKQNELNKLEQLCIENLKPR